MKGKNSKFAKFSRRLQTIIYPIIYLSPCLFIIAIFACPLFFQTGKNSEKFIFRLIFYPFCIIL